MFCSLEHFNSYNLSYLAMNALHFTVHYIVVSCLQTFAIAFKNVRRTVQKMLQTLMFLNLDTLRLTFILFTPNRKPRFAVSGFTFAVLANMKLRLTFFFAFNFLPSKL